MKIPIEKKKSDEYDKFFDEKDKQFNGLGKKILEMKSFTHDVPNWMKALDEMCKANPEMATKNLRDRAMNFFLRFTEWLKNFRPILLASGELKSLLNEILDEKLKALEDSYDGTNPKQAEEERNSMIEKMMAEIDSRFGKLVSDADTFDESYFLLRDEFNSFKM